MTVLIPEGVSSFGTTSVGLVPTIADPQAPTLTEITGVGSVNASCYMFGDFMVTTTAAKVARDRRLCQRKTDQSFGEETTEVTDIQYIEGPQEDGTVDRNKVKTAIPAGTEIWVVERRGIAAETEDFATGDVVNLHRVVTGPQNRTKSSDGDGGEFTITQSVVHRESVYDVEIVAGV